MKRSQILEIKKMKLAGKTNDEIAEYMQINVVTVRRWLQKLRDAGHDVPKDKPGQKPIDLTKLED